MKELLVKKQSELMAEHKPMKQINISVIAHSRRKQIVEVSLNVREESMKVNAEFCDIDDVINA